VTGAIGRLVLNSTYTQQTTVLSILPFLYRTWTMFERTSWLMSLQNKER